MITSPFFRRLLFPYLLLVLAGIAVVGLVAILALRNSHTNTARHLLRDEARLIGEMTTPNLDVSRYEALQAQVGEIGKAVGQRITIVRSDGTVVADNEADAAQMENHGLRPEIMAAASLGEGTSIRPSGTIAENFMYFARRVTGADGGVYYIRLATHLRDLQRHLNTLYTGIALASFLAMAGAAALSFYFARRRTQPLVELTEFAEALRSGDLRHRLLQRSGDEVGVVAAAMNAMADSLSQLIDTTHKDQALLQQILSGMNEGVLATNAEGKVLLSNSAAATMLEVSPESLVGKEMWQVTRTQAVLQAAQDALSHGESRSIAAVPVGSRHLDIAIAPLSKPHEASKESQGLVIVLHDATEAVRYQELRKQFVANVSHELRTPLTVIKGYAETLRDGALHDDKKAPQYLEIIERHVDQLTNLVSDLLQISRLEAQHALPHVEPVDVFQVVTKAADLVRPLAVQKKHDLTVQVPSGSCLVPANADYLQRAITNLLENAVKYTPDGGTITVAVHAEQRRAIVEVTDNGIGIPLADLPRIFERFYRVDRSRSRDMGGTGLGLAIVKHIAQAHGGSVEVGSVPGQGSTFRLVLPMDR